VNTPSHSSPDLPALDALTGGAISAATAGERLTRVRQWLDTDPSTELLQQVFKELSARDKGAAKPIKEKIEELRRSKTQDALADEWAAKAQVLLNHPKLNLADAMAWSRDAAKAGAPLSREPLSGLRLALADLVKHIEDLAHRAQVLRESALLMAQRIEVLSTKPWTEAMELRATLQSDLQRFDAEWQTLSQDRHWHSVDPKYPSILNEGAQHIHVVWDAFNAALTQTEAAAADASLPLPGVPAWADQLRVLRGEAAKPAVVAPSKPVVDPAQQALAVQAVQQLLQTLEAELAQGHSKATTAAAAALRQAIKTHARVLPAELEANAQSALTKAAELEGWQRWRADQLRTELVVKAEALLKPATAPQTDTAPEPTAPAEQAFVPVVTGRKLQETLRQLRDAWKQTDQGGQPNHALWKRFDQACNRAYPFVQEWLEKAKAESQAHREQRLALLAEVAAWTQAHAGNTDWKKQARELHQFSERWRNSGHLSEKTFAELQVQWKAAMSSAHAALEKAQAESIAKRRAMIEEAKQLASAAVLKIDAVKSLQQRWQAESQAVALERKLAQKLWDAFRQPLDEAFQRKTQDRSHQAQALSAHDQAVLEASQALEKAIAQGDAAVIRQAMQRLNDVVTAQSGSASPVAAPLETPVATEAAVPNETPVTEEQAIDPETPEPNTAAPKPVVPAKKVVAVRGDDRPGQKKTEPVVAGRFGDKPGARRNDRDAPARRSERDAPRSRDAFAERGPRLGDAAYRAQRHAVEQAEAALKKLAMQAHGEVLVHLLSAWQERQVEQLPAAKELGQRITAAQRQDWVHAITAEAKGDPATSLLRLEMAAEVSTPADHQADRRALQLQLLTKRHEAPPAQTWAQDVAVVLHAAYTPEAAQRLQNVLRVLLRR
jgi:ATP-dependent RNA helicase SUPV3L1/SUV3